MTRELPADPTAATRRAVLTPTRRSVLTYGALASTGAAVAGRAGASRTEEGADASTTVRHAAMFPDQLTPNATVEIVPTDLEWAPAWLETETRRYRTQVDDGWSA